MKMQLEIGYNYKIKIREEQYFHDDITPLNVMYLSDLHFNAFNGGLVSSIVKIINHYNPTILLLGGDYVDMKNGLRHFIKLLYAVSNHKNVFAVAGNHDYFFGINTIKKLVIDNNVTWIECSSAHISIGNTIIQIDGNITSIDKIPANHLKILCLHKPIDIHSVAVHYNLAFAGHLHGCQFVFRQNEKGLFPGRFFYRWNVLREKIENCNYYISKGLGDTLPIRLNCSPEIIVVNILKKIELHKMNTPETIKETVKQEYNQIVQNVENQGVDWWRSRVCEPIYAGIRDTYPDMDGYVDDANLGLGCGFPVKYSDMKVGDAVLDLGCAAGIDSFIARQVVGEQGSVIGIDITPFLIERARRTAEKLGYQNVTFVEGDIEAIPLETNQIEVIISNGVFSLVPHKERVFAEMYRVLKPGAHFCIADLIRRSDFPDTLRIAAEKFTGCLNGIAHQNEYLRMIADAGFKNIELREERSVPLPDTLLNENLNAHEKIAFLEGDKGLFAITIYGVK